LLADLLKLLAPYGWFYGMGLYLAGWLNAEKRFAVATAAPALIPVCGAVFLLWGPEHLGIAKLAWGSLCGALLQVAVLLIALIRLGARPWYFQRSLSSSTRRMVRHSVPLLLGTLLTSGIPFVDSTMAGLLDSGSVAVLGYAERVNSLALVLLVTAVGQALYPWLAEQAAQEDWIGLRRRMRTALTWVSIASVPCVAALFFGAPLLVSLLFERGAFGAADVPRVTEVLRYMALQIPFCVIAVLSAHVVNALRAGKFLLLTTAVNLSLNIFLNWLLVKYIGLKGIALATVGVYLLSALMLQGYLARTLNHKIQPA
jgi:putative peptidoglycan lipid II flippase